MAFADDFRSWARNQRAPVTVAFVVSLVAAALIFWFVRLQGMEQLMLMPDWPHRPWSILTYPWAYMPLLDAYGVFGVVFFVIWTMWTGGAIEQAMGSGRFAAFIGISTVLAGLFVWIGAQIFKTTLALHGPWLTTAAITLAWCTRNAQAQIMFWGILPLSGRLLGILTFASVLLTFGFGNPAMGVFACLHLVLVWAFAAERLPIEFGGGRRKQHEPEATTRGQVKYDEKYFEEVRRREKEREEQERLRKLLEG